MKGSRRAPLFLSLKSISRILSINLGLHLVNILLCELRLSLEWFDVIITIQMQKVLWLHIILIPHAVGRCPGCDSLQLILKHVATAVALDSEQDFPPLHLIEILMPVAPDLAYYDFEGLVGVLTFFRLPFPSRSSISGLMVDGTCSQSFRICSTVVTRFCTSSRLAW